jgi:hypothetical protein
LGGPVDTMRLAQGRTLRRDLWEALGLSRGWRARLQPMSFEGDTGLTHEVDDQEGTR